MSAEEIKIINHGVYKELQQQADILASRGKERITEDSIPTEGQIYRGTTFAAVIFNLCTGEAFPSNNAMRGFAPYKPNSRTFLSRWIDEAARYANWNPSEHSKIEGFLGKYGIELPYPGGVIMEFIRGGFRYLAPGGTGGWQSGIVSQEPLHVHHLTKTSKKYVLSSLQLPQDSETGKLLFSK